MSTRLFPKNKGADAYVLTGIAARCDWVVLSDTKAPRVKLVKQAGAHAPRHVFLSLRAPFDALAFFVDEVLPKIEGPFVLVSGSEDVTVPNQLDLRWRRFAVEESRRIGVLLDDPRLIRWFAENLDDPEHSKFSPMPLGMVFPDPAASHRLAIPDVPPLRTRQLRALCAHRVREGPQWDVRRRVTQLCRTHFADLCTIVEHEVSEEAFVELIREHAFVICADGGGIDPSPKAWQALLHGAIPIIRSSGLDAAYEQLPVAFVDSWDALALSPEKLAHWVHEYAGMHEGANRATVVERLGIDFWWAFIQGSAESVARNNPATLRVPIT
jgi:hypothetical protein